ncbi:hypothetical protein IAD21_06068 [Abditibacteriota bacterium]|nr:hypothetical protein IAD21_06068 [Abditibacteriota bacterium]
MTWPTHALLGMNTVWLLALLPPDVLRYDVGVLCAAAALGALLPDLDANESKVKHLRIPGTPIKPFLPVAQMVNSTDQHRGLLHSLWGVGMACAFASPLCFIGAWAPALAFALGYASHLLGDSATRSGIRLLYPHARRFHLLPLRWRLTTGSLAEDLFMELLMFPVIVMLLLNLKP